jgi:AraC family transcriptional activator of pobA
LKVILTENWIKIKESEIEQNIKLTTKILKKILNYEGLYGENTIKDHLDFINFESLETRSKFYNWEIKEHLHSNLFQFFLIETGNGILSTCGECIDLEAPCLISIPNNTLHGFAFQPNVIGTVLTFSTTILEEIINDIPNINLELNQIKCLNYEQNLAGFKKIIIYNELLKTELIEILPEKRQVSSALLKLLFIDIYRQNLRQKSSISIGNNNSLNYFNQFQSDVKSTINSPKSISEYAKSLKITPVHLHRVCKNTVQKSPLQIVQDLQVIESKKYLLHSDYNIAEISYLLNFKDPSYFTRVFKKITGYQPKEFRKLMPQQQE